MSGYDVPALLQ